MAEVCAPGSQLVCDYSLPKSSMSPQDLQLFEALDTGGTRRGEPLKTLLHPAAAAGMLSAAGFRVVEDLSASEIRLRYLEGRSDGLDIPGYVRLCRAEREED
jgi:O-methyltransferase involved in polyketide biosynthesis